MGKLGWVKMDSDLDGRPGVVSAGLLGTAVWLGMARLSAQFDLDGVIGPEYRTVPYLAKRFGGSEDEVRRGVVAMIESGLARMDGDSLVMDMGSFVLPGTLRQRKNRECDGNATSRHVTPCNATSRSVTLEEKRREEKREERSPPTSPPPGADRFVWSTGGQSVRCPRLGSGGSSCTTRFASGTPELSCATRSWIRP